MPGADDITAVARYILPVLAVIILLLCLVPLLRRKPQPLGNIMVFNPQSGETFPVTSRETSVGRHRDCDIVLDSDAVSRQHAVIICGKDGWYIKSLDKDSPVFVNGAEVQKRQLISSGDKITIADKVLIFNNKETPRGRR